MNRNRWLEAANQHKPFTVVAILAMLSRLPFLFLPGAGRDEAIYYYWAFNPEPAYSPLMQLCIRLFAELPIPKLIAIRLLSLLIGILILLLFDTLLRRRGLTNRARYMALTILAFTPWQTYVGGILHPDNFLLASLLGFLLAVSYRNYLWMTLAVAAAFWAKLSGILLAPTFFFMCLFNKRLRCNRCWQYPLLYLVLTLPVFVSLQPELLQGIAEFGRVVRGQPIWESLLLQLGGILFLAPFGLPFAAYQGLKERLASGETPADADPEQMATLLVAGTILLAFTGAILTTGQVKGNWILPALVILWPDTERMSLRRVFSIALPVSIIVCLSMAFAFTRPPAMNWVEQQMPLIRDSYSFQAGTREARVSATRSWTHRFLEYQAIDEFADAVMQRWYVQEGEKPKWIISDDYGLAAKLLFVFDDSDIGLLVPGDLIFYRSLPDGNQHSLKGSALIIATGMDAENVWPRLKALESLPVVVHPVTGSPVHLAISDGQLHPGNEPVIVDFWRHTVLGRWISRLLWQAEPAG